MSACLGERHTTHSTRPTPLLLAIPLQDCCLAYALMANTGQNLGAVAPPPVMLPAALGGSGNSAGSGKPLAGMRAGICWKVRSGWGRHGCRQQQRWQWQAAHLHAGGILLEHVRGWGMMPGIPQLATLVPQACPPSGLLPCLLPCLPQWFDDAAPAVADACRAAVQLMEADGLELVELAVPELGLLPAAHSCTITCVVGAQAAAMPLHCWPAQRFC